MIQMDNQYLIIPFFVDAYVILLFSETTNTSFVLPSTGGNVKWCSYYAKVWYFLKKLNIQGYLGGSVG